MSRNKATINQITGLVQELANKSNINHTHTLDNLSDVVITNPSTGQVLKFDGTQWVNGVDNAGSSTYQEVFTATANQTKFTLVHDVTGVALISLNGIIQKPNTDYSISGKDVNFNFPLDADSEIVVTYGIEFDVAVNNSAEIAAIQSALTLKQDKLVSGTNIKTINGQSVLGSGDLVISGGYSAPTKYDYVRVYQGMQIPNTPNRVYTVFSANPISDGRNGAMTIKLPSKSGVTAGFSFKVMFGAKDHTIAIDSSTGALYAWVKKDNSYIGYTDTNINVSWLTGSTNNLFISIEFVFDGNDWIML